MEFFVLLAFAGAIAAVVSGLAIRCAKRRAYAEYLVSIAILTVVGIVVTVAMGLSYYPTRQFIFVVTLMYLPLAAVYLIAPGLLVRKAAAPKKILIVTLLVTTVVVPLWLFYDLYLECSLGLDCI